MGDNIAMGEERKDNTNVVEDNALSPPITRLSRRHMTDWFMFISAISLIMISSLLIANGRCCIRSTGIHDSATMCVGASLSVQSWLAVAGVEFSFLYAIVLPRAEDITVSKIFIHLMVRHDGVTEARLSRYRNSLTTAPLLTQIKDGYKRVLSLRACLSLLVVALSISYKFSFVSVSTFGFGVRGIDNAGVVPTGFAVPLTGPISANLQNIMKKQGTSTWRFTGEGSWVEKFQVNDPHSREVVFGPNFQNPCRQLPVTGMIEVKTCYPIIYRRLRLTWKNASHFSEPLSPANEPEKSRIRFDSPINDKFVDVHSIDGDLVQANGERNVASGGDPETFDYMQMVTFKLRYCVGYVSWSVMSSYRMQNPEDIGCIDDTFDLRSWNSTQSGIFAKYLIQGIVASNTSQFWVDQDSRSPFNGKMEG